MQHLHYAALELLRTYVAIQTVPETKLSRTAKQCLQWYFLSIISLVIDSIFSVGEYTIHRVVLFTL